MQGLLDAAQHQLVTNYTMLKQVCDAAGAESLNDDEFKSFKESVGEWNSKLSRHSSAAGMCGACLQYRAVPEMLLPAPALLFPYPVRPVQAGLLRCDYRGAAVFCRPGVVAPGPQRGARAQRNGISHLAAVSMDRCAFRVKGEVHALVAATIQRPHIIEGPRPTAGR